MPKLIAKERFYYAGRNLEAEEEFEAEAQDVAILTDSVSPRARKLSLEVRKAVEPVPAASAADTETSQFQTAPRKEPARRRQYMRRDLRAED
jgi:hypothetical protein